MELEVRGQVITQETERFIYLAVYRTSMREGWRVSGVMYFSADAARDNLLPFHPIDTVVVRVPSIALLSCEKAAARD